MRSPLLLVAATIAVMTSAAEARPNVRQAQPPASVDVAARPAYPTDAMPGAAPG